MQPLRSQLLFQLGVLASAAVLVTGVTTLLLAAFGVERSLGALLVLWLGSSVIFVLFGTWLVIDGLVLSFMKTSVHPYYCLSLAPAAAAMFAIGIHEMWRRRDDWLGQIGLATMLLGTGVWSFWILGRNASWLPPLRWAILVVAVAATVALLWALLRFAELVG